MQLYDIWTLPHPDALYEPDNSDNEDDAPPLPEDIDEAARIESLLVYVPPDEYESYHDRETDPENTSTFDTMGRGLLVRKFITFFSLRNILLVIWKDLSKESTSRRFRATWLFVYEWKDGSGKLRLGIQSLKGFLEINYDSDQDLKDTLNKLWKNRAKHTFSPHRVGKYVQKWNKNLLTPENTEKKNALLRKTRELPPLTLKRFRLVFFF